MTGTTGADQFSAYINTTTATVGNSTLTGADSINGGEGIDTLSLVVEGANAAGSFTAAAISGFEKFVIKDVNASGASTYDFGSFAGETEVTVDRSTQDVTLSNMAADTIVNIKGNAGVTNGALTAGVAATATSGTLNIDSGTVGTGAVAYNGAGLTTLTINSTGASNSVGAVSTSSAVVTAVNINATTALSMSSLAIGNNATPSDTLTIAGGAANVAAAATTAARAAVVLGTLDSDFTTVNAAGLTVGGISATMSATASTGLTGGAGDDTITTGAGAITGTVNAGEGTGDRLILAASAHMNVTTEGAQYTNFEILRLADGQSLDLDMATGSTITAIEIVDASAAATSATDLTVAQAAAVTFVDFNDAATIGVKGATTVGSNDVLNITISDGDTTTSETLIAAATDGADWTIAGVETINIIAVDDFDADALSNITGLSTLTARGAGDVDIITGAVDMGTNGSVNFGDLTGTVTFNAAALATNAFAYTGSAGIDTLTDNVVGGNQLTTGAGNDIITLTDKTGGAAVTVVTAGAGADAITANMLGNVARDGMKFVYAAGDSVSDTSTSGISATLTDTIDNLDGAALSATAGSSVEFDTEVSATAVTAGSVDVVLGTTTVTNAFDFFVDISSATVVHIYQDTDGDRIIESGEFAVSLTGIQTGTLAAGEFSITSGDLILATA